MPCAYSFDWNRLYLHERTVSKFVLSTLDVILNYSITREMYTTFIDQLKGIQCLSLLTPGGTSRLSCATAIFGIIEAAVYAAGSNVAPDHKDVEGAFTPEQDSRWPLSLNWSHVAGLMPLIVECATQNVKEVLESENPVLEVQYLLIFIVVTKLS